MRTEMKLVLPWRSDRSMRAIFSNIGAKDKNHFYLLMVFHISRKGGFARKISVQECQEILKKENSAYIYQEKI